MNLFTTLKIIQLIVAVFIVFAVLIQAKGSGLSRSFSGFSSFYRTRRGFEKFVFIMTILFGVIFVVNSLALIFLS